jgi:hypothetical protein
MVMVMVVVVVVVVVVATAAVLTVWSQQLVKITYLSHYFHFL